MKYKLCVEWRAKEEAARPPFFLTVRWKRSRREYSGMDAALRAATRLWSLPLCTAVQIHIFAWPGLSHIGTIRVFTPDKPKIPLTARVV